MAQITLYLDEPTNSLLDRAVQAQGVSKSRWVSDLIRKHTASEWPQDWLAVAGKFPDFPLAHELRAGLGVDAARIGF